MCDKFRVITSILHQWQVSSCLLYIHTDLGLSWQQQHLVFQWVLHSLCVCVNACGFLRKAGRGGVEPLLSSPSPLFLPTPASLSVAVLSEGGGACFTAERMLLMDQPVWKPLLSHSRSRWLQYDSLKCLCSPLSLLCLVLCHPLSSLLSPPSPARRPPRLWLTGLSSSQPNDKDQGSCPPICPLGPQPGPKASPRPLTRRGAACSTQPAQVSGGRWWEEFHFSCRAMCTSVRALLLSDWS